MSNSTLAARISALIDKWNGYKNALRDLLTKQTGSVDMEDGTGTIVSLPTFPSLQKSVTTLTDTLTGAVSQAQDLNSQSAQYANQASNSATASDTARAAAVVAKDAAAGSATAAGNSATTATSKAADASASASTADTKATAADASATAAAGSATTAKGYADNAGFSAASAQSSKDASASSQTLAMQYANAAVNVQVQPGQYSAFHWSEQARLTAIGAIIYKGKWSAASGALPVNPKLGDFYIVSTAGTVSSVKYGVGDMLIYDGDAWDRIDNQQVVTSVAGRTGAVTLGITDIASLQTTLDTKLPTSTFTGHGHSIGDVSGLQGALDAKLPTTTFTGHTHTIANVTGLQSALDAKVATASNAVFATVTASSYSLAYGYFYSAGVIANSGVGVRTGSGTGVPFAYFMFNDNGNFLVSNGNVVVKGVVQPVIFVQAADPAAGALPGDLWIW